MLRLIFTIALAILLLSFFGISIRAIVESPTGSDNIAYVWQLIKDGWGAIALWLANFTSPIRFPG
ncbi:MAG TPA: hypothetical protein VHO23_03445 [Candidatus Paceibacterota bacterium]|nr:hypothetical protein [Candidatus Paceibacterota bacterium]